MFKFELSQTVTLKASGEQGEVIARAEYTSSENNYCVRYKAADGRCAQCWWEESALEG